MPVCERLCEARLARWSSDDFFALPLAVFLPELPRPKRLKLSRRQPQPKTQSLLTASLSCTEVMDSDKARVWRYSSFAVMLLRKVTSTPNSGENDSLMLTVETLNMELGTRLPVVASVMKPMVLSPASEAKVEKLW